MAPITEQAVRELASIKGQQSPIVSCYLDVDGRRYPRRQDYEAELDRLVRRLRGGAGAASSAADDVRRIEEHVQGGFDRSRVRGLAIFSCGATGVWKVLELPVSVRNQLVVNSTPHVRQLEFVLDEYEPMAVLLADRQRARVYEFELGELVHKSELFDQLPRHDDDRGDWDRDHRRDHSAALAQRHLRRAAQAAFVLFQERPFNQLIIGAPEEIARDLRRELHSYLRDRVVARLSLPVSASDEEVRQAAMGIQEQVERSKEAAAVAKLRDALGAGGGRPGGVAGLEPTLQALFERRVDTLLVSDGYEAPGWRCRACSYVAAKGRTCPLCEKPMDQVDDVVEEAIEEALLQSCRVEICRNNPDLDVLGRLGAILRF